MVKIIDLSEVQLMLGLSASMTEEERALISAAIVRAESAVTKYLHYDPVQRSRTEYYPVRSYLAQSREVVWETSDTHAFLRHGADTAVDELQLQHIPVRSDPAIDLRIDIDGRFGTRSGSFASTTQKTEGTDFWPNYDGLDDGGDELCRDGILRSVGQWPLNPGSVKVVYTAGYTPAELHGQDDLVDAGPIGDAVVEEAARRAKRAFVLWRKNAIAGHVAGIMKSESMGDYSYTLEPGVSSAMFGSDSNLMPNSMQMLQDFVNVGWPMSS